MTPAIDLLRKLGISHQLHAYEHDAKVASYGAEAAEKLGLDPAVVFKTLVVETDAKLLAVAIVPVTSKLSMKLMARAVGARKTAMADAKRVQNTTGYVLGGVSPLGQKRLLTTRIDASAEVLPQIHVSAGRRGLEIEIAPAALAQCLDAAFADLTA